MLDASTALDRPVRLIRLPSGRRVTLAAYVAGWRKAKSLPAGLRVRGWDHFPTPAAEIVTAMRRGLHDRINIRGEIAPAESRVHPAVWSRARTPRVVLERGDYRALPPAARRRLAHRVRED